MKLTITAYQYAVSPPSQQLCEGGVVVTRPGGASFTLLGRETPKGKTQFVLIEGELGADDLPAVVSRFPVGSEVTCRWDRVAGGRVLVGRDRRWARNLHPERMRVPVEEERSFEPVPPKPGEGYDTLAEALKEAGAAK